MSKVILKHIIVFLLLFIPNTLFAQLVLLKGKVVDKRNSLKLLGVTVKAGTAGTITDKNGYFELSVPLSSR